MSEPPYKRRYVQNSMSISYLEAQNKLLLAAFKQLKDYTEHTLENVEEISDLINDNKIIKPEHLLPVITPLMLMSEYIASIRSDESISINQELYNKIQSYENAIEEDLEETSPDDDIKEAVGNAFKDIMGSGIEPVNNRQDESCTMSRTASSCEPSDGESSKDESNISNDAKPSIVHRNYYHLGC